MPYFEYLVELEDLGWGGGFFCNTQISSSNLVIWSKNESNTFFFSVSRVATTSFSKKQMCHKIAGIHDFQLFILYVLVEKWGFERQYLEYLVKLEGPRWFFGCP